jgi:hypothetical protein
VRLVPTDDQEPADARALERAPLPGQERATAELLQALRAIRGRIAHARTPPGREHDRRPLRLLRRMDGRTCQHVSNASALSCSGQYGEVGSRSGGARNPSHATSSSLRSVRCDRVLQRGSGTTRHARGAFQTKLPGGRERAEKERARRLRHGSAARCNRGAARPLAPLRCGSGTFGAKRLAAGRPPRLLSPASCGESPSCDTLPA